MKISAYPRLRSAFGLMASIALSLTAQAQTSYFTNTAGGDWNVAANWDRDFSGENVIPAEATNANITTVGAVVVDYTSPMAATSFGSLTVDNGATLNINAAGFNQDQGGAGTAPLTLGSGIVNVGSSGVWTATNGGTTLINLGGTLNVNGSVNLSPIPATAALAIASGATVNVNAGGSILSAFGNVSATGAGRRLFVDGGTVALTNANLSFTTVGGAEVATGGTLSVSGQINLGASGTGNTGFFTNNGGIVSAGSTRINPNNNSSSQVMIINGGTNNLGAVSIRRSSASSFQAIGAEGLVISNGLVNMTSLSVGAINESSPANSHLSCVLVNGTVTNTGAFTVNQASSGRAARFLQLSGLLVSTDPIGARVAITNAGSVGIYAVLGGTNIAERFVLGDLTNNSGTVNFTNAAKVYIGSGGIVSNLIQNVNVALNIGGTFGANADWSSAVTIILAGGSFAAEGLDGAPHNISLNNVVRSSGQLIKNGGGILTLNAANTYSGNTVVNQGTLALGASGTTGNSPQIIVASGATFDVSGVAGYTLAASRTIAGSGSVSGGVSVASGGIINPTEASGPITFANSLSQTGGAINHFDLPTTPGPGNDKIIVTGDLNVSGVNTLEIVGGGSPGTLHTLIQYGGNFNGTLANFAISGASGVLTNDTVNKTIGLTIATSVRTPTNVVWVGNGAVNDWDTVNVTNWLNTGTSALDYFVSGDNVLFDATGIANPNVNLVGNVAPATLTVGAAGNYSFGGAGNISGSTGLTKTNTGTLTVTGAHSYSGGTTIAGGVLDAGVIAIGGANSSIGSSAADAANLVLDGGTLRYAGASVTTDRAATINAGGGTVDVVTGGSLLTVGGVVGGAGGLTKSGAGTLVLSSANGYSGGTVINGGTLQAGNASSLGTGSATNNSATLRIQGALTLSPAIEWNGNTALELSGVAAGNAALRGAWLGGGTVNVYFTTATANQTFTIGGAGNGGGHMWDFSGTVDFNTNSGFLRINNDNTTFNFGSSNATFNVGTGTGTLNQRNGSTTTHFGALNGGPNTTLAGRGGTGSGGTTTYSIGGKNVDCIFEGTINNGSGTTAITKVGSAKFTVSGNSSLTGPTSVESGTMQIDGSYGSSAVTVLTGATLQGNGSFGGTVVINAGATLAPGIFIGQMTMSNSLQLDFGSTNVMQINKALGTNDSVVGLAGLVYGGTLVVNNLGGTLAEFDSFKLFDAASYAGVYEALELPALGAELFWDTSKLTVNGTISVIRLRPAISGFGMDGGSLFLTGTNGGNTSTHYIIVTSTDVTTPLASWTPVVTNAFDGGGNFAFTNAVNTAEPTRFYNIKTP